MKHALITGSSSGIGLAIAKRLLDEGYFVFINHRPGGDASPVEAWLSEHHADRYQVCAADLSTMDGVDSLCAAVADVTDALDVLVLNAGATQRGGLEDIRLEDWERVFATNVTMPVFLVQKLSPMMPDGGSIVFMGSLMGILPHSMSLAYGVSKAAVNALAENLPKFFEGRGITVNAIAPGFVETPWQTQKPAEIRRSIESKVAHHRFARPEEIAELCWHVVTNRYLNGSVIRIDGGYSYR